MLIDISMPLDADTQPVPGHPEPSFKPLHTIAEDAVSNTIAAFSLHTGTHVDAPSHMLPNGRTIDRVPIEWFVRDGVCLDLSTVGTAGVAITAEDIEHAGLYEQPVREKALLLATGWADAMWTSDQLYVHNPYLSHEAAMAIAEEEPQWLGLDFAVDNLKPWPNHHTFFEREILLVENLLRLSELPRKGFRVFCFPLRLTGQNGAPARVIAEINA